MLIIADRNAEAPRRAYRDTDRLSDRCKMEGAYSAKGTERDDRRINKSATFVLLEKRSRLLTANRPLSQQP